MIKSGYSHQNESAIYDQLRAADDLDELEKALTKYVLNPDYKYLVDSVIDDAIAEYGNTSSITIYRGLNFDTKEDYDKFMKLIKSGTLRTKGSTSWSPDKKQAKIFAITKPSYMEFMDSARMAMISAQRKASERITGYRGIILKTRIAKGKGVDLRRFKNHAESEVLLPAGTYKITYEEVLSYKDTMKNSSPDAELAKLTRSSSADDKKIMDYILKNYKPDQLSDESKHKIFQLTTPTLSKLGHRVEVQDPGDFTFEKHRVIYAYMSQFNLNMLPYYLDSDVNKLRSALRREYNKLIKEVFSKWITGAEIKWQFNNHNGLARFCGVDAELTKAERSTIGKDYHKQDQIVKDINKVKDPKAKRDAIDAELERVKKLIGSI